MASRVAEITVCPNCGDWAKLDDVYGWCRACRLMNPQQGDLVITQPQKWGASRRVTSVSDNPAAGTKVSFNGTSVTVKLTIKPICACCGSPIFGGNRNSVFCRKSEACRKSSRRYTYLYRVRGLFKAEALAIVLSELAS